MTTCFYTVHFTLYSLKLAASLPERVMRLAVWDLGLLLCQA